MSVLYRKYRSKSFSEVIGQETVKSILIKSIQANSFGHAYLFVGPRGTGKTSLARIFAKSINCLNFEQKGDCCNECENCLLINSQTDSDIIEMDAASNRGIEEIRMLKETVNYLPTTLKYKVYIIDEVHMLTKEAFNALLKTLEEPPAHVIFLMATTEPQKVPITILSRTIRLDLSTANKEDLIKKISFITDQEGIKVDEKVFDLIYDLSEGSFRDAESILGKLISNFENKEITYKEAQEILGIFQEEYFQELSNFILSNQKEEISNQIESGLSKNVSGKYFVDQYIKHLKKLMIGQSSKMSEDKILLFFNSLLDLKSKIRHFEYPNDVIALSLMSLSDRFKSGTTAPAPSPIVEASPKNIEEPASAVHTNPASPAVEVRVPVENSQTVSNVSDNNIKEKLIQLVKKNETNQRLIAILEGSEIKLDDKSLKINNQYSFNVTYLEKPENRKCISNLGAELGFNSVTYNLDKSVSTTSHIPEKAVSTSWEPATSSAQPNEDKKSDRQGDNTEIVETMLL